MTWSRTMLLGMTTGALREAGGIGPGGASSAGCEAGGAPPGTPVSGALPGVAGAAGSVVTGASGGRGLRIPIEPARGVISGRRQALIVRGGRQGASEHQHDHSRQGNPHHVRHTNLLLPWFGHVNGIGRKGPGAAANEVGKGG